MLPSGHAAPVLCAVSQASPQALQLVVVALLTHALPHAISPAPQLQVPLWHVAPDGHTVPQAPQCWLSICSLTQAPLQAVSPALQVNVHAPVAHEAVALATFVVHGVPQAPQFVRVFTCVSQPLASGAVLSQSR